MDVTTNVGQVSTFENYSWYWYGIFPKKAYQPGAGIGILFILECYWYWIFFKTFIPAQSWYQGPRLIFGWYVAGIPDIETNIALVLNWYYLKSLPIRYWYKIGMTSSLSTRWVRLV